MIAFCAEEHTFTILFYFQNDDNGAVLNDNTTKFYHSPTMQCNDGNPPQKDLWKKVYGTPVTPHNCNPLYDGLDIILEELVKCVLVMEHNCPSTLKVFDQDGDQYSTQHHNHRKHHFPVPHAHIRWPC